MSTVRVALTARRLLQESPAWALLRTDTAPVALAVLGTHFSRERRHLAAAELFDAVETDLVDLRARGFDLRQPAAAYCRAWLTDGYLVRRPGEAREEIYELSDGTLTALRFIDSLAVPRTSVTESRLATIVERIRRLSIDTDPDVSRRIAALQAERNRLDARIEALARGDADTLDEHRAVDQAHDVLSLASELPEDFARVRAELDLINRDLRARLIEEPASRGSVLDDIFRGVDVLAESDAGRSFSAFHSLLLDPEQTTAVDDDLDALLERPFARSLSPENRTQLRRLLPAMQDASGEINDVMTSLSRSLRRFVQSEELAEERLVHQMLREAFGAAGRASSTTRPWTRLPIELALTGVHVTSPSAMKLQNPADSETSEPLEIHETQPADLEALREAVRASEIDMQEVTDNVNSVLAAHGPSTIADILSHRRATQGVASVVGLLVLAEQHATRTRDAVESVSWRTPDGERRARVPRFLFQEAIA
ncbi:DUF3375 domain-containing protein [Zhihengliuella salsuginis]|uniref:DUF3375 domain-containing protein n=1 Tax=Zhihengliuella salsuginis TaxID=578222 RepID=A0ABQ3GHA9_9MICC|nr:DUF3375 domain-containing protein [Zhihengliuella salsuginis]GHD05734.1 hypothetical protein GCM10008096_15070 [Zhihengliuella salsuginis]